MSAICFFYGTPLMALYVTLALLAGGHFRRSRTAQDSALVAGDFRLAAGARVGMHRALSDLAVLSSRLLRKVIRRRRDNRSMKTGMNLLFWTTHVTEQHDAILDQIKALGFDAVEVPIFDTADLAPFERLGKRLKSLGLGATAVTVMGPETNPISPDPKIRDGRRRAPRPGDGVRPGVRLRDPLRADPFGHRRLLGRGPDRGRVQVRRRDAAARRREGPGARHQDRRRIPESIRDLLPDDGRRRPPGSSGPSIIPPAR